MHATQISRVTFLFDQLFKMEELEDVKLKQVKCYDEKLSNNEESSRQLLKQQTLMEQQNREILVKCTNNTYQNVTQKRHCSGIDEENDEFDVAIVQELKKLIHHTKTGIHFLQKSYQEDFTYLSTYIINI